MNITENRELISFDFLYRLGYDLMDYKIKNFPNLKIFIFYNDHTLITVDKQTRKITSKITYSNKESISLIKPYEKSSFSFLKQTSNLNEIITINLNSLNEYNELQFPFEILNFTQFSNDIGNNTIVLTDQYQIILYENSEDKNHIELDELLQGEGYNQFNFYPIHMEFINKTNDLIIVTSSGYLITLSFNIVFNFESFNVIPFSHEGIKYNLFEKIYTYINCNQIYLSCDDITHKNIKENSNDDDEDMTDENNFNLYLSIQIYSIKEDFSLCSFYRRESDMFYLVSHKIEEGYIYDSTILQCNKLYNGDINDYFVILKYYEYKAILSYTNFKFLLENDNDKIPKLDIMKEFNVDQNKRDYLCIMNANIIPFKTQFKRDKFQCPSSKIVIDIAHAKLSDKFHYHLKYQTVIHIEEDKGLQLYEDKDILNPCIEKYLEKYKIKRLDKDWIEQFKQEVLEVEKKDWEKADFLKDYTFDSYLLLLLYMDNLASIKKYLGIKDHYHSGQFLVQTEEVYATIIGLYMSLKESLIEKLQRKDISYPSQPSMFKYMRNILNITKEIYSRLCNQKGRFFENEESIVEGEKKKLEYLLFDIENCFLIVKMWDIFKKENRNPIIKPKQFVYFSIFDCVRFIKQEYSDINIFNKLPNPCEYFVEYLLAKNTIADHSQYLYLSKFMIFNYYYYYSVIHFGSYEKSAFLTEEYNEYHSFCEQLFKLDQKEKNVDYMAIAWFLKHLASKNILDIKISQTFFKEIEKDLPSLCFMISQFVFTNMNKKENFIYHWEQSLNSLNDNLIQNEDESEIFPRLCFEMVSSSYLNGKDK